jgi:hypothetical protein
MVTTTTKAPPYTTEQAEAVLSAFEKSPSPLTAKNVSEALALPKLNADKVKRIIEDLLLEGKLFECFLHGKQRRFWKFDEEEHICATIEKELKTDQAQGKVVAAVKKTLSGVSCEPSIKECVRRMLAQQRLHTVPGKGKVFLLSLNKFDPVRWLAGQKKFLADVGKLLNQTSNAGLDQAGFFSALREILNHEDVPKAEKTKSSSGQADVQTSATTEAEVEQLILKGMRDLEPRIDQGTPVLLRDLRKKMPVAYQTRAVFDAAVFRLVDRGEVVIHQHDHPGLLSEDEKNGLVRDETGTYFLLIARQGEV